MRAIMPTTPRSTPASGPTPRIDLRTAARPNDPAPLERLDAFTVVMQTTTKEPAV